MIDSIVIAMGVSGVALANAAKAKLVGLLSARLAAEGVDVGEVTIAGIVKARARKAPASRCSKAPTSPRRSGRCTRRAVRLGRGWGEED